MFNRIPPIILVFISVAVFAEDAPSVEISNGWLQGTLEKSYNGKVFSSFEGIPYAKPPLGDLRFEPPEEPNNWTGIWIANTKYLCIQSYSGIKELAVSGDEDCLYVNVYVPRAKPSSTDNLNVIVHVHGGAFMLGGGHFYAGPRYLMDEEVVLVTFNYRLGPFGFLSTEDEVVPGNNGLKDQVQALRWIQKNIKYFGGNPDSVTLTGMSAGGASVHFHYFSPLSKGLFHRGVSQSGNALNPWALQEVALEKAKRLAVLVGCPIETAIKIIDCLKSRPAYKIAEVVREFFVYDGFPFSPFGPVVEKEHDGAFLTRHPYKMLVDKTVTDVPWITSVTKDEGIYPAAYFSEKLSMLDQQFDKIAPHVLDYNYTVNEEKKAFVTNKIREHYFEESITLKDFIKLCGDRHFFLGAQKSANLQAQATESPVYFYVLGYRGQHSFSEYFLETLDDIGVSHADDVLYYFDSLLSEEKLSKSDEKMKSVFMEWLLTYASNSEPKIKGVSWKPTKGIGIVTALHFNSPDHIKMKVVEDLGSSRFWSKIPFKENENIEIIRDEL